ncbi:hypothetical protein [Devosia sp.]|uniref:hypothetical protein n=1 Tax=Devosia sp. TaxID=1871048 RepID=UPI001A07C425|nr:hypothetical protein [Devosia sp.]MBE0580814.1 hypothetical protein [Devosia sp.]
MTKAAPFTQADITKLLKGAKAAGMTVRRITIDRSGRIIADFADTPVEAGEPNEWDVVFKK